MYCSVSDVDRFLRGQPALDDTTSPTESEAEQLIKDATDTVDNWTNRAWRERRVTGYETSVNFSHRQMDKRLRSRRNRSTTGRRTRNLRGQAVLPHPDVRTLDPAEGDALVALLATEEEDITDNEGRSTNDEYTLDERRGVVRPSIYAFRATKLASAYVTEEPRVRVTYRYGVDAATSAQGNLTVADVPGDIREATAKLAAHEVYENDLYAGSLDGGGVQPESVAQRYERQAEDTLSAWRWTPVVMG